MWNEIFENLNLGDPFDVNSKSRNVISFISTLDRCYIFESEVYESPTSDGLLLLELDEP